MALARSGLMRGLSTAIDEQFDSWNLTAAEKDVALLLLKGFSHKEVAETSRSGRADCQEQAGARGLPKVQSERAREPGCVLPRGSALTLDRSR